MASISWILPPRILKISPASVVLHQGREVLTHQRGHAGPVAVTGSFRVSLRHRAEGPYGGGHP
jgi:hypothetical protein